MNLGRYVLRALAFALYMLGSVLIGCGAMLWLIDSPRIQRAPWAGALAGGLCFIGGYLLDWVAGGKKATGT